MTEWDDYDEKERKKWIEYVSKAQRRPLPLIQAIQVPDVYPLFLIPIHPDAFFFVQVTEAIKKESKNQAFIDSLKYPYYLRMTTHNASPLILGLRAEDLLKAEALIKWIRSSTLDILHTSDIKKALEKL